jgi:hypothetical protein
MATLTNNDIAKRNNVQVLHEAIVGGSKMQLGPNGSAGEATPTGKIKTIIDNKTKEYPSPKVSDISDYLSSLKSKTLFIEVKVGRVKKYVRLTEIFKSKLFGGTASKSGAGGSERQERGLVDAITTSRQEGKGKKVYTSTLGPTVDILSAMKNDPKDAGDAYIPHMKAGKEPYTDLIMTVKQTNKTKQLRVSMKGDSAPSLAGGGLSGLMDIDSAMTKAIWDKAIKFIKKQGFKQGDIVDANKLPDMSVRIPDDLVQKVVVGTAEIGGPITHMYIGPMDVVSRYNKTNGELTLNGKFYTIEEYIQKIPNFYIVIRKRDIDESGQIKIDIDGETTNAEGLPVLFKSPAKGKNNTRVIVAPHPRGREIT